MQRHAPVRDEHSRLLYIAWAVLIQAGLSASAQDSGIVLVSFLAFGTLLANPGLNGYFTTGLSNSAVAKRNRCCILQHLFQTAPDTVGQ